MCKLWTKRTLKKPTYIGQASFAVERFISADLSSSVGTSSGQISLELQTSEETDVSSVVTEDRTEAPSVEAVQTSVLRIAGVLNLQVQFERPILDVAQSLRQQVSSPAKQESNAAMMMRIAAERQLATKLAAESAKAEQDTWDAGTTTAESSAAGSTDVSHSTARTQPGLSSTVESMSNGDRNNTPPDAIGLISGPAVDPAHQTTYMPTLTQAAEIDTKEQDALQATSSELNIAAAEVRTHSPTRIKTWLLSLLPEMEACVDAMVRNLESINVHSVDDFARIMRGQRRSDLIIIASETTPTHALDNIWASLQTYEQEHINRLDSQASALREVSTALSSDTDSPARTLSAGTATNSTDLIPDKAAIESTVPVATQSENVSFQQALRMAEARAVAANDREVFVPHHPEMQTPMQTSHQPRLQDGQENAENRTEWNSFEQGLPTAATVKVTGDADTETEVEAAVAQLVDSICVKVQSDMARGSLLSSPAHLKAGTLEGTEIANSANIHAEVEAAVALLVDIVCVSASTAGNSLLPGQPSLSPAGTPEPTEAAKIASEQAKAEVEAAVAQLVDLVCVSASVGSSLLPVQSSPPTEAYEQIERMAKAGLLSDKEAAAMRRVALRHEPMVPAPAKSESFSHLSRMRAAGLITDLELAKMAQVILTDPEPAPEWNLLLDWPTEEQAEAARIAEEQAREADEQRQMDEIQHRALVEVASRQIAAEEAHRSEGAEPRIEELQEQPVADTNLWSDSEEAPHQTDATADVPTSENESMPQISNSTSAEATTIEVESINEELDMTDTELAQEEQSQPNDLLTTGAHAGLDQSVETFLRATGVLGSEELTALVDEFEDMDAKTVGDVEELLTDKSDLELFIDDNPAALDKIWAAFEQAWQTSDGQTVPLPADDSAQTPAPAEEEDQAPPAPAPANSDAENAENAEIENAAGENVEEWLKNLLTADEAESVVAELHDMNIHTVRTAVVVRTR